MIGVAVGTKAALKRGIIPVDIFIKKSATGIIF